MKPHPTNGIIIRAPVMGDATAVAELINISSLADMGQPMTSMAEMQERWEVTGWISTLGVRRPWRRRGLGQALLLTAFNEFYRRGEKIVALSVDAASQTGATRLYERAGMCVYQEFTLYEKELRHGKPFGEN
jgi:mycothiol synthase